MMIFDTIMLRRVAAGQGGERELWQREREELLECLRTAEADM